MRIIDERLSLEAYSQLAGILAGVPYVKVLVDRPRDQVHFLGYAAYRFHGPYISERLLKDALPSLDLKKKLESYYLDPERDYYLGVVSLHTHGQERFFALETTEIDTMDSEMVLYFFRKVQTFLDPALPLFFKPANLLQESIVANLDPLTLPRVFSHELFASAQFVALHQGKAQGRLRAFRSEAEYRQALKTLEWFDMIAMDRVPDDVPRISGMIHAQHVTPLSHTNVLASGWEIPNAIQLGILERIEADALDGEWVELEVVKTGLRLEKTSAPENLGRPIWSIQRIELEEPVTENVPIVGLDQLGSGDRARYGTKAANLGELRRILEVGSDRLTPEESEFIRKNVRVPRGIAIPFSVQREFLESSPRIQQMIGKLKMALELNAKEVDSLCLSLQSLMRSARFPEKVQNYIDERIAERLSQVSSFVVRSSSNAEDLKNFSAAGIYESINQVTCAEEIPQKIKEVWASLVSPRSVRLRQEVGISLDDCYMGVIVQEEIPADLGGVLVTTNPLDRGADPHAVYINASKSASRVVQGTEASTQHLLNASRVPAKGETLQTLAAIGKLLERHFSPGTPVDIEWIIHSENLYILQLRPY